MSSTSHVWLTTSESDFACCTFANKREHLSSVNGNRRANIWLEEEGSEMTLWNSSSCKQSARVSLTCNRHSASLDALHFISIFARRICFWSARSFYFSSRNAKLFPRSFSCHFVFFSSKRMRIMSITDFELQSHFAYFCLLARFINLKPIRNYFLRCLIKCSSTPAILGEKRLIEKLKALALVLPRIVLSLG